MTIAEIKNYPALLREMTEDLDDFIDDTEVVFETYAFSYDPEWNLLGASPCLSTFANPDDAVEYAKGLNLTNILLEVPGAYVVLEVESVAKDPEGGFVNLGTIYTKNFF